MKNAKLLKEYIEYHSRFFFSGFYEGRWLLLSSSKRPDFNKWNDPKLAALNPGKKLPDLEITIVHRADGSGTTFNWTDYLSSTSAKWAEKVGKGAAVKWPAASSVGGKGNEGVAANVQRVKGSIGYVEYAYVKKNNLTFLQLQNK